MLHSGHLDGLFDRTGFGGARSSRGRLGRLSCRAQNEELGAAGGDTVQQLFRVLRGQWEQRHT